MQSKLLKIKLNPDSRGKLKDLIDYMQKNISFPKNEMAQKGYFWDSVFFDQSGEAEYLYVVLKSEDFSKIMMDESELDATPYREIYEKFRKTCWAPEPYQDIEPIACFNSSMVFSDL